METFVKISFAKISLAAQSELPEIWEGEGGGCRPSAPSARTLMGAITCFFNQTHYMVSVKFDIIETGL